MTGPLVLAGDVGGTNVRLSLHDPVGGPRRPLARARYRSAEHPDLESIIERFLAETGAEVDGACIGVAGPVLQGRAVITNLPWVADTASLGRCLDGRPVHLVNDLVATATAVPHLGPDELHVVHEGVAVPHGPIGVIAPGTGLGQAYLVWDGHGYRAMPSEGGHASFAPRTPVEIDLLRFLLERFEHVSYERVCSGSGLPNLYDFFADRSPAQIDAALDGEIRAAVDPTPLIMRAALDPDRPDPTCRRTLETFVSILGAETGNLALKLLATGGMYLGGGLPPRILPLLTSRAFLDTYAHKGRFGDMVATIPVRVILAPDAALIGAAATALSQFAR
jgi:glucokinase